MQEGNCDNVEQLLGALVSHKEIIIAHEELGNGDFIYTVKLITEENKEYDFQHRVIIMKNDLDKLFKYIKQLKKEIAKLKKHR